MKVSTRGRYAIRIMLDISMNGDGGPVSFKDVSQRQGISIKYMEQIGSMLTRAGFLNSVRGAHGGYSLANKPSEYTIGSILRVTEGPLVPVLCLEDEGNACARKSDCMTYSLWEKLNNAINEVVDNTTLQDLIDDDVRRHMVTIDSDE
jgi:Rrf2 family protein